MNNASQKVAKLLALARDPAATPDEADTARRLAEQICDKFGVEPSDIALAQGRSLRLPGSVEPGWNPIPQPDPRWHPAFRKVPSTPDMSGISMEQARYMALEVLNAQQNGQCYLSPSEETLVQQAFDGLLNEYGKILLMGLHTVVI